MWRMMAGPWPWYIFPDKSAGLAEMARVLKPGGRLQIGDILVQKAVGDGAKQNIDLWKG